MLEEYTVENICIDGIVNNAESDLHFDSFDEETIAPNENQASCDIDVYQNSSQEKNPFDNDLTELQVIRSPVWKHLTKTNAI